MAPRRQPVALYQSCLRHVGRVLDQLCQQQLAQELHTAREAVRERQPIHLQAAHDLHTAKDVIRDRLPPQLQAEIGQSNALPVISAICFHLCLVKP